jgi:hypothetical protein
LPAAFIIDGDLISCAIVIELLKISLQDNQIYHYYNLHKPDLFQLLYS